MTTSSDDRPATGLRGIRQRIQAHPNHRKYLLITCIVGMFSTTFPVTILAVSLTRIAGDLDSTPSTVAWATTAPMLAAAVSTPILGRLGDLRGHRRLYFLGFTISIVFAVLTWLAWDPTSLIAFRTVGQLAGTATVPASLAMLYRTFPPEERVKVAAYTSSTLAAAAVSGLVIGGPLTELFGWRLIFILQGGLSVVALVGALFVFRKGDQELTNGTIDWPGAIALAITAFSATFAVNRLPVWGPRPIVLVLLAVFPVALLVFIRIERRAETPILPLELIGHRQIRLAVMATFLIGASWAGAFIITPILMQTVLGLSVAQSGFASFPRATFISLSGPVAARLGMKHGERRIAFVALIGVGATMGILAVASVLESVVVVIGAIAAGGWAFGHCSPALMSIVTGAVAEEDLGLASSLQQTGNQIGAVFGSGLLSSIAADASNPGPFVFSYLIAGALALAGALVVLRSRETDVVVAAMVPGDSEIMESMPVTQGQVHHRHEDD